MTRFSRLQNYAKKQRMQKCKNTTNPKYARDANNAKIARNADKNAKIAMNAKLAKSA